MLFELPCEPQRAGLRQRVFCLVFASPSLRGGDCGRASAPSSSCVMVSSGGSCERASSRRAGAAFQREIFFLETAEHSRRYGRHRFIRVPKNLLDSKTARSRSHSILICFSYAVRSGMHAAVCRCRVVRKAVAVARQPDTARDRPGDPLKPGQAPLRRGPARWVFAVKRPAGLLYICDASDLTLRVAHPLRGPGSSPQARTQAPKDPEAGIAGLGLR